MSQWQICCMCPITRWVGLGPTTSALGARFQSAVKIPRRICFLSALPIELPPVKITAAVSGITVDRVGLSGLEPEIFCL